MICITMVTCIPSGMHRSVELNVFTNLASRQGCILNRMQERDVETFSTERCIPNGIQVQKFKPLQDIYSLFLKIFNIERTGIEITT